MAETSFETPWGTVELLRGETPLSSPLRAWSAADRLVLAELHREPALQEPGRRLVLVNDAWGALAVPLANATPLVWNDSALAFAAIDANRERNGLPRLGDAATPSTAPCPGPTDLAVIMVPKSHDLLAWQLDGVATALAPRGRLLVAGMSKHLTKGVVQALEGRFHEVMVRRAVGKARLIDASGPRAITVPPSARPAFTTSAGVEVFEAPGVFSAGHLDVGTALLLDVLGGALATLVGGMQRCADLGCGNGVVGTTLAARNPHAQVTFADVSHLAVAAARATAEANGVAGRSEFLVADGLPSAGGSYDLIVSNPPFHQDHAADAHLTERLLRQAEERLLPEGRLVVVVQRHLELHRTLQRVFGEVTVHSKHPSHVVLVAHR